MTDPLAIAFWRAVIGGSIAGEMVATVATVEVIGTVATVATVEVIGTVATVDTVEVVGMAATVDTATLVGTAATAGCTMPLITGRTIVGIIVGTDRGGPFTGVVRGLPRGTATRVGATRVGGFPTTGVVGPISTTTTITGAILVATTT